MRIVIIGGVAGGMSAATRLRRLDNNAEIVVLERSGHVSYANCGLPYYVGGVIEDERYLLLQTPRSLHRRFRLDVRVHTEAVAVDAARRVVTARDIASGEEYELGYDRLVLSPGASPIIPPVAGIERAMALRTVEDVERIASAVEGKPQRTVVIGGGFIGLEITENLVARGIETSLVEAADQLMAPLDPEMAQLVEEEVRGQGVHVYLRDSVVEVTPDAVRLASGERLAAELVIVAIGVRPDVSLARQAGLAIGPRGGVAVDQFHRTSEHTIYAIGDAVEKVDALDGEATLVPLANIANRQGRVVADHIAGRPVRPLAAIGTAIVKVFDLTIATTGWNEKRLATQGRTFQAIHTHPGSHAEYYPGSMSMAIKLLIDPDSGAILGAQAVGSEGVDKRIDVISTAMRGGLSAPELADLELAYAPPFGSAKDPVNMLGYIAENLVSGLIETAQWYEVDSYRERGWLLLDVRTPGEFARGQVPGSVNLPIDEIRDHAHEIDNRDILVICEAGHRGHTATLLLNELGFNARNLDGGIETWQYAPIIVEPALAG